MQRRDFLPALAFAALATKQGPAITRIPRKGRLKQSCFGRNFGSRMVLADMCRQAARLGAVGFDGVPSEQWPVLKKFGLISTMALGGGITIENGIIQTQLQNELVKSLEEFIDTCATNGCPSAAIVGGQRRGMSYAEGADSAVAFLNRVKNRAEQKGVTLCLEVMNSKYQDPAIGRQGQICDHLDWAAGVCTRVNSPRVKILFDIYHVQIMDGNIAANIRAYLPLIGHFHTGGGPGRHEIDETQELNYRFIFRTIADLGFTGVVAHEYDPTPGRDPIRILEKVLAITDV
jgi:hydroxypyruvate isomerase